MELKQLETFCAIVEWGSFSLAAEKLFLTQPTVSARIIALEKELGAELFDRSSKKLLLSEAGQTVYRSARNIVSSRDRLLNCFNRDDPAPIRIGASSVPADCLLPELIAGYKKNDPSARFCIRESDSAGIINMLKTGNVDIGIT